MVPRVTPFYQGWPRGIPAHEDNSLGLISYREHESELEAQSSYFFQAWRPTCLIFAGDFGQILALLWTQIIFLDM